MHLNNPIQMNDWAIKSFIMVVFSIQLAFWGAIGLDTFGLNIAILRPLIAFIYLTFVPGIIILRILKLHKLGNIETLLYSVGLSLSALMLIGAFINIILPSVGISKPISIMPLVISISGFVLILCILCYMVDKDFYDPTYISITDLLSLPVLLLFLIPFLAVFGVYLENFYHINNILMLMITLIAGIAILICLDLQISKNIYPLAVFLIALSLVFHGSLLSMYIWGWDINAELYFANLVIGGSAWDPNLPNTVNAMLSVVMLAPIYSIISGLDTIWVFKIIYSILFSLVPLGLYRTFQKQTNDMIAFLSCFFFMSVNTFYIEMLQLARQEIAELFLVLLILLMIDTNMNNIRRSFLLIVFGFSLAVSHYGLCYLYIGGFLSAWIALILLENSTIHRYLNENYYNMIRKGYLHVETSYKRSMVIKTRTINLAFVFLLIVFALTWYMYVSNSSTFNVIVGIGNNIRQSIMTDFLKPESVQGLRLATGKSIPGLVHDIGKIILYLNQLFIIIGGIVILLTQNRLKLRKEFIALSIFSLCLCFFGVSVPFFASSINMSRLYQITLIFLALFCVIGGMAVFQRIIKLSGISYTNSKRYSMIFLSVYLALFLLYQTGFVWEITGDFPTSISLNSTIDYPRFNDREVSSAIWLGNAKNNSSVMYADMLRWLILIGFGGDQASSLPSDLERMNKNSYIFSGTYNINYGVMRMDGFIAKISSIIDGKNSIYNNGGAIIYSS